MCVKKRAKPERKSKATLYRDRGGTKRGDSRRTPEAKKKNGIWNVVGGRGGGSNNYQNEWVVGQRRRSRMRKTSETDEGREGTRLTSKEDGARNRRQYSHQKNNVAKTRTQVVPVGEEKRGPGSLSANQKCARPQKGGKESRATEGTRDIGGRKKGGKDTVKNQGEETPPIRRDNEESENEVEEDYRPHMVRRQCG